MTASLANVHVHNCTNLVTKDNTIITVDNNFEAFTGFQKEEVCKKPVSKVFNEMFKVRVDANGLSLGIQKKPYLMFTKNNEVKEIEVSIKPGSELNETVYSLIEFSDISFSEKFNFLKVQFMDNVVGIAVYSVPDLILLKANQKYLDAFEYPFNMLENSIGHPIYEIIRDWSGSRLKIAWDTVLKTQKPQYLKEQVQVGINRRITYWDKTITPVFENGECKYIYSYNQEMTDKIETRKQLAEESNIISKQKEELEAIIDNMPEKLFMIDRSKHIKPLNKSARNYFCNAESQQEMLKEIENTKFYDAKERKVDIIKFVGRKLYSGSRIKLLRLSSEKAGRIRYFDVSGSPVSDINGVNNFILCIRDVTENVENDRLIKEQRESLLKSEIEKNQILEKTIIMKDEFLSIISHEFKTPLNVIISALQALELFCRDELSQRAKKYMKSIRQNTFRQLRLVNNLLDIARARSGNIKIHKKNIDIVFITRSIVESVSLYAQQKSIKLEFISAADEKIIGIDEEKYERILLNLLSNAIKFTPEKKQIIVKLSLKKGYVCILVKDNGVGIPKDKQEMIFERFGQVDSSLTRQAEGTGIGLSLVRLFVNALGGKISVRSELGKGSSFTVLLPDEKVQDNINEKSIQNMEDNRLVQSIAIEFSDIYLS